MKKLYRVEISHVAYVLADNEEDAGHIGAGSLKEDPDGCGDADTIATEVHSLRSIPDTWQCAFPYGEADERGEMRISDLLKPKETVDA